MITQRD